MNFGFASTSDNSTPLQVQIDHLKSSGCGKIFTESTSVTTKRRGELKKLLNQLTPGDQVIVYKIRCLNQSTIDFIRLVAHFKHHGIVFKSIFEGIDTSTTEGDFIYKFCVLLLKNNQKCSEEREADKKTQGKVKGMKGRPRGLTEEKKMIAEMVLDLYDMKRNVADICKAFSIGSFDTFYKYLAFARKQRFLRQQTASKIEIGVTINHK